MTIPIIPPIASICTGLDEFIRPDSDVDTTNWSPDTGSTLYTQIDEVTASDTDYVQSDVATADCPTKDSFDFEVGLSNPSARPGGNKCQQVWVRHRAARVEIVGTGTVDLTVELKEGSSVRASALYSGINNTITLRSFQLTDSEMASINDWNNLSLRFLAEPCQTAGEPPDTVACRVTWAAVEFISF